MSQIFYFSMPLYKIYPILYISGRSQQYMYIIYFYTWPAYTWQGYTYMAGSRNVKQGRISSRGQINLTDTQSAHVVVLHSGCLGYMYPSQYLLTILEVTIALGRGQGS